MASMDSTNARTRILDAAERLFAERGFDGTATSAIAAEAAVPKGLLFYYFPNKKTLLTALVDERLGDGVIDAVPLIETGNPVRSLLNLSERFFQLRAVSDLLRVILWREGHIHLEVRRSLAAHRRALHATIEAVLAGSLLAPVSAGRLRAAALAWGAIVTARPLLDPLTDPGPDRSDAHAVADLTSLAELLCAGLQAGATAAL